MGFTIKNEEKLIAEFQQLINEQKNLTKLIEVKNIFFKKNVQHLYQEIKLLTPEKRKEVGLVINNLHKKLTSIFLVKKSQLEAFIETATNDVNYDININQYQLTKGSKTIISFVTDKIIEYFKALNFSIVEGKEVTTIENNMDRLNIGIDHPARDPKDTFYIDTTRLLRTHCTAVTAEVINNHDQELKVLSYGNVYRNDDDDPTHSHQFSQVDIVWLKKNLTINHLKTITDGLLKYLFGQEIKTRYRISFFPFTEPSFEVDITCFNCHGHGCLMCKQSGWIEILGAGMLHHNVLQKANIKKIKTGLAMGIGIERIAMLKYGINDIRDIYNNDFRLLTQLRGVK